MIIRNLYVKMIKLIDTVRILVLPEACTQNRSTVLSLGGKFECTFIRVITIISLGCVKTSEYLLTHQHTLLMYLQLVYLLWQTLHELGTR